VTHVSVGLLTQENRGCACGPSFRIGSRIPNIAIVGQHGRLAYEALLCCRPSTCAQQPRISKANFMFNGASAGPVMAPLDRGSKSCVISALQHLGC